ncbi:hypothetical protein [Streptomyces sp. t39]|uniref:hypothetical protein n=1 Tax=Streptomyces sp. t39 TaxID=1828156 RepID=UPI0016507BFE|nr:hypothetical protein [Streptomyces sp. t39]
MRNRFIMLARARVWIADAFGVDASAYRPERVRALISQHYPGGWVLFVAEEC